MKIPQVSLGLLLGLCAVSCSQPESRNVSSDKSPTAPAAKVADTDADEDGEAEELEVPLDQVPAVVKAAAMAAVPGIELEEAEMEVEDGVTVYDVEGELDGVEYEIEVRADGTVLEIEQESGDDDDHGDDEEDDDDDEQEGGDHDGDGHDKD